MLEVREIAKSYGSVEALRGVDLEIAPGEILGLLGPNGAGKTTLISIVAGLRDPDRGTVRIGGYDVAEHPFEAREHLGLAPQSLGVYLQLSARANLRYFGRLAGLSGDELKAGVDEVADALALADLLDRPALELSGGEQRRLHTAMAMLHHPPLLLLDEPTAGVDVHTRSRLLDMIKRLADRGIAVCYTTHYLHEVEELGASVAILEDGSIIAQGRVRELVRSHGQTMVEMRFDGAVPAGVAAMGTIDGDDAVLRIRAPEPATAITEAFTALGPSADRVRSVELMQPSLESVYLSLTGRRFELESNGKEQ
jgi:ABC-2 type transport system ATP-binding protein